MEVSRIIDMVNKAYVNIQNLEIQPTRQNVVLISDSIFALEDACKAIAELQSAELQIANKQDGETHVDDDECVSIRIRKEREADV